MKQRAYSVFGNIALVNFPRGFKGSKRKLAEKILRKNFSVKTVLEKVGKFSGRLRKIKAKWLAGEKNKEVLYKENRCTFRFNIETTYFSPRLSNERKEIAEKIKKGESVLVMFAGVAPFSIVIAKNSEAKKVYSNEINREANKYGRLNVELNKIKNKIEFIDGDIKRIAPKLKQKFDVIVMPRPQLKDSFLKQAFILSKKGTRIFYYGFCKNDEINLVVDKIKKQASKSQKKIKILNKKIAGEIAPYKVRCRIDFRIL